MRTIPGHLVSMNAWSEWVDYENYVFKDEKIVNNYDAYRILQGKMNVRSCVKGYRVK